MLVELYWLVCILYLAGWGLSWFAFFREHSKMQIFGKRTIIIGWIAHLAFFVFFYFKGSSLEISHLSNLLIFLSLLGIVAYFIIERYFNNSTLGIIFPAFSIFLLFLSNIFLRKPFIPANLFQETPLIGKSLLFIHVSSTAIGYVLFGMACISSLMFLYEEKQIKSKTLLLKKSKFPSLGFLDSVNYKAVSVGFFLLTIGLLLGMSMGNVVGTLSGKISWRQGLPMITWWIYGLFLLDRSLYGIRGHVTAIWSVIGFIVAISSFIYEISYLISKASLS
ncbi:MAG: ABC-type uncharacterized transport system permease subunit [bacterium]|jgi:ABC-type uncharacterized transport system permease subunit